MGISYYLTGNFVAGMYRFYYFLILGSLATLAAQAWGFFVGATMPMKVSLYVLLNIVGRKQLFLQIAVFIGPILAVLFSVFGFCTRYIDITIMFRWMWHISYFRSGFHAILNSVYGDDRPFLDCPESAIYCHFKSPKVFLDFMMISDSTLGDSVSLMMTIIVVMHTLTLSALWYKLTKR